MHIQCKLAGLIVATGIMTATSLAQSTDPEDIQNPILVTGSRLSQTDLPETPSFLTIERADIALSSAAGALELLRGQPGIFVTQDGPSGAASFVSIRGGDENFVQVLIDGIKVNDPTDSAGGAFDYQLVDPLQVEQIEISKRGAASIYGSDALSGVINIQLRQPGDELEQSARLSVDTEKAYSAGYLIMGPLEDGAATASISHSDGGTQLEGDRYERTGLNASFRRPIGDLAELDLVLFAASSDAEQFPETSGGPRLAENRETATLENDLLIGNARLQTSLGNGLRSDTRLSFTRSELSQDSPAILVGGSVAVPANSSDSRFDRTELDTSLEARQISLWAEGLNLDLIAGAAAMLEDGRSDGSVDFGVLVPAGFSLRRETLSGFAEASANYRNTLSLTGSVRHDKPESFDARTTLGARLSYAPSGSGTEFELNWAEGYKLPSFFALGSPLVGNPNLLPEESETRSVSVSRQFTSGFRVGLAVFDNTYTNLVEFDPDNFTNINLGEVEVTGLEVDFSWQASEAFSLRGSATISEFEVDGEESQLRFRPEEQASLDFVRNQSERLSFGASTRYVGERPDQTIAAGTVELPDYVVNDLWAGILLSHGVQLRADILNIGDTGYEEAIGYPARGRSLRISLRSDF